MQIKPMDTAGEDHTPLSHDIAAKDVDFFAKNHQHKIVFNCDGLINRDQSVKIKTIMITFADQPCRL